MKNGLEERPLPAPLPAVSPTRIGSRQMAMVDRSVGQVSTRHAEEISPFFNQRILACPASSPHTTHGGAGMVLLMSKAAQDYS